MSIFKKLFKQTFIYGLATVLPRAIGLVLIPLFVEVLGKENYGIYASLMAYLILGNVLLSYGMETAFFRFINKHKEQQSIIQSTVLTSLTTTTVMFLVIGIVFLNPLAQVLEYQTNYVLYGLLILALDALVILPFAWLRANEKPMVYTIIKVANVVINLSLNLFFFLVLPSLAESNNFWNSIYMQDKVAYVFIANVIASGLTFLALIPLYVKIKFGFNTTIWNQLLKYAIPVMIAGIAFSINEAFDKILLKYAPNVSDAEVGVYAACYKLGVFMTLFITAFKLGIEPFFFNHAKSVNAKENYASITKYFVIFGSIILLVVMVYVDLFKQVMIPDNEFWVAIGIVPYILIANLCLGIYHNLSVWYKLTDKTKYGAIISIIGAIVTLTLNFILIPIISYKGSAIATLAAYGSMMIISYIMGKKHYKVPYDLKRIGLYLIISIAFSLLAFYQFDRNILIGTLLLLIFLGIVIVLERNDLKILLQKNK